MALQTITTAVQLAAWLLQRLEHDGGATVRLSDASVPARGYAVGRPPYGLTLSPSGDELERVDRVATWLASLPHDVTYVGVWRDTEDGTDHLDAVDVFAYGPDAHMATVARGEIAYYSLHDHREVRVRADTAA